LLHLTHNEAIGDAGVAALSATIQTVTLKNEDVTVFEVLDLSGCGIGDTGAEALAIALEKPPLCVCHLNLSNNQISNEGAATLGRALASDSTTQTPTGRVETLDLSNNKDIGDYGAMQGYCRGTGKGHIDQPYSLQLPYPHGWGGLLCQIIESHWTTTQRY
jgi:hypothetical protein